MLDHYQRRGAAAGSKRSTTDTQQKEAMKIEDGKIVYSCDDCGRDDCKLWRDYQTFLIHQTLRCGACALKSQNEKGPISAEGFRPSEWHRDGTDQIGWLVPAVPTVERDTFWGYTSVPQDGVDWWQALPT